MRSAHITLLLPAYNEELDLPDLLARIEQSLSGWADYRLLIVDDGSSDQTAAIVQAAAQRMPVELIQHAHNQGLGAAIRTGLRAAAVLDGVLVTMDADNTQDPALIRVMLATLEQGFDVVIASRFQAGSQEFGVPPIRLFLSHLSSAGLRILAHYPGTRDYTCGFRVYRIEVIRRLIDTFGEVAFLKENGFACMLELLLNLRVIGAKVAEVPLILRYDLKRGRSKMHVMRTIWRYTVTVARTSMPVSWRAQKSTSVSGSS